MARIACRIDDPRWRAAGNVRAIVRAALRAALAESARKASAAAEVAVVLTDDATVRSLNARWRGKDEATNVLAFPAGETAPDALGDIVIAFETVRREADGDGKPIADHLAHLVVHGVLHLLGYDHLTDRDADGMEARETAALARLGIADPYAGAVSVSGRRNTPSRHERGEGEGEARRGRARGHASEPGSADLEASRRPSPRPPVQVRGRLSPREGGGEGDVAACPAGPRGAAA